METYAILSEDARAVFSKRAKEITIQDNLGLTSVLTLDEAKKLVEFINQLKIEKK